MADGALASISDYDPRSQLVWRYDAVHGHIDIRDVSGEVTGQPGMIAKLLRSPAVERLRRVKQLGFTCQSYPAADHSRYAHSLGTMHMMRRLFERLRDVGEGLRPDLFAALKEFDPKCSGGSVRDDTAILCQHLLVAALLQDVGELPCSLATKRVYRPSANLRRSVDKAAGFSTASLSHKQFFTIACLNESPLATHIRSLSMRLLIFLMTGHAPQELAESSPVWLLRHMLDGAVDADRLDYVFRDAHHTVGGLGSAGSIIECLLYYDAKGPVFSDPGPVANFLATRAHLYSTVYSAPENRFRMVLLSDFLSATMNDPQVSREFFGAEGVELSLAGFLRLDDDSLFQQIKAFHDGRGKNLLPKKAQNALELLCDPRVEYQCFWLPYRHDRTGELATGSLPDELHFDTFDDHRRQLYATDSVRIKSPRFDKYEAGSPIALERCGGPFSSMLWAGWSILPMQQSILLFVPREDERRGAAWDDFNNTQESGWLYQRIIQERVAAQESSGADRVPSDTRHEVGFKDPLIFISFAFADLEIVYDVARVLHARRRKYRFVPSMTDAMGTSAAVNCDTAVREAKVVMIIASIDYATRYADAEGYIAQEVLGAIIQLNKRRDFKVAVVAVDKPEDFRGRLPLRQLVGESKFVAGPPLRHSPADQREFVLDQTLASIDTFWSKWLRDRHEGENR